MSTQSITPDIVSVFIYSRRDARAECSCGYESRTRRRRGRAVIDALMHAANTGCRENWPLVYNETTPRRGGTFLGVASLLSASTILGAALYFSAPARADAVDEYTAQVFPAICEAIAEEPYVKTVEIVVESIVELTGESYEFAGMVVGTAVRDYCPWNRGTVERFIAKWTPAHTMWTPGPAVGGTV